MASADTLTIARRYAELFATADPTAIAAVAAPTVVMHLNGVTLPPTLTLLARIQRIHAAFPDYHLTIDALVAMGDTVALRVTAAGIQRGDYEVAGHTLPASGKPVQYAAMLLLRIADGRVVEEWAVADVLGLVQQLGMTLTPPAVP